MEVRTPFEILDIVWGPLGRRGAQVEDHCARELHTSHGQEAALGEIMRQAGTTFQDPPGVAPFHITPTQGLWLNVTVYPVTNAHTGRSQIRKCQHLPMRESIESNAKQKRC